MSTTPETPLSACCQPGDGSIQLPTSIKLTPLQKMVSPYYWAKWRLRAFFRRKARWVKRNVFGMDIPFDLSDVRRRRLSIISRKSIKKELRRCGSGHSNIFAVIDANKPMTGVSGAALTKEALDEAYEKTEIIR